MSNPEDFRCDECGAAPGRPCIYIWPTNVPPYSITVYRPKEGHRREQVPVPWDGHRPYVEQIRQAERWIRIGGGEIEWPMDGGIRPLPKQMQRVGTPTNRPHTARFQALYAWEQQAEQLAMQEYLGEWLNEYGSIFALD